MSYRFISALFLINLTSCNSIGQMNMANQIGIVEVKMDFYNENGKPIYTDILRTWYKDSTVIEEVNRKNTVTASGKTTENYELILYRYIDLKSKTLYDYKSFTDTAKIINKAALPDSMMNDYGWSFYSDKIIQIQGQLEILSDTAIKDITYKRIKYSLLPGDAKKNFDIGYLKCDGKQSMFSLEKHYSPKINCTMLKSFSFHYGKATPYASLEVNFVSDTLSKEELKVFEAWESNAKNNPVK
jgi:hypothetical protein